MPPKRKRPPLKQTPPKDRRGGNRLGARKYSIEQVAAALRHGFGLYAQAAAWIAKETGERCDRDTIAWYVAENPVLEELLAAIKGEMGDLAESRLFSAVHKGETWAVKYYLSTQCRDRGYVTRQETTGKDGGPVKHDVNASVRLADLDGKDPAELARLYQEAVRNSPDR